MVIIGFERNRYTVTESVGMMNVCAVVTFPAPDVTILSNIILSVNTVEGTAGECRIYQALRFDQFYNFMHYSAFYI